MGGEDHSYSLVLAFDTDDSEFCRGYEAASVYEIAKRFAEGEQVYATDEPGELTQTVHATNAEMMLRTAEAHGLRVRSEELDETWLHVTFTRTDETEPAA